MCVAINLADPVLTHCNDMHCTCGWIVGILIVYNVMGVTLP